VEGIIARDCVNILLSHNPDTFDRASELGIDLSLAGHTYGGQAALEFISPEIAPSRLVTPYVAGWFRKPGGSMSIVASEPLECRFGSARRQRLRYTTWRVAEASTTRANQKDIR
jgi:hypothetical protein